MLNDRKQTIIFTISTKCGLSIKHVCYFSENEIMDKAHEKYLYAIGAKGFLERWDEPGSVSGHFVPPNQITRIDFVFEGGD